MKIFRLFPLAILVAFSGACSSEPVDCTSVSLEDCESEGCNVQNGSQYNFHELCLEEAKPIGCVGITSNNTTGVGFKDNECALFPDTSLPKGWNRPEQGDCPDFVVQAPSCEGTPKCADLAPADCTSPRCYVIEGQRFLGTAGGGTNNAGCFEPSEPLGCQPANTVCGNLFTAGEHDGACYLFSSTCIPKGWEYNEDCPSLVTMVCE